ncbi:QacE family quaternary ammonium compound efflux SMR transporter [Paenibacillus sp. PK3_47]|uniref:DMT family transporter n=1 Tax=Paenibacillus sp. PK3_47 TaxID=2072642 RepID=UPI00201DB702|nr:multidrug efflux SMR transporter [Paenibacillus sp. PK3_47]UQZ37268.1 QacE family quaternary ammonium compound efflux SMR transporter [Paenibacillus sp. PK3_47]
MKSYIYLALAICFEIFGTTMLKLSDGFSNLLPGVGVVFGMGLSFYCLSMSLKVIPLSLAYAVWSGVGTAVTALLGVVIWKDHFTVVSFIAIAAIIAGVVLLNASNQPEKAPPV